VQRCVIINKLAKYFMGQGKVDPRSQAEPLSDVSVITHAVE
jgi:hypothetical protein